MSTIPVSNWNQILASLGPAFANRAAANDGADAFVAENYGEMQAAKLFSALVPQELGGNGRRCSDLCAIIRRLGQFCGSTALAFSMHQHLVATALWNYRQGRPGEILLRTVAEGEKVLVSTGAADWLSSSGVMERCEGGYRFTGNVLITSGQYTDPVAGRQVLYFSVSMAADRIRIAPIWEAMGMRGTGPHTIILDNVFVPEQAISLRRPCGQYHAIWNVILTVALPLLCAVYVGIAETAASKAREIAARKGDDGVNALVVGEMQTELTTAQIALESMIGNVNELNVEPCIEHANRVLIHKDDCGGGPQTHGR